MPVDQIYTKPGKVRGRGANVLAPSVVHVIITQCRGKLAFFVIFFGLFWQSVFCPCVSLIQVVKLHTKLGKPIPSTEPSVVTQTSSATTAAPSKASASAGNSGAGGGGGGALGTSVPSPAQASSAGSANSSYLKPVNMVNNGSSTAATAAVQGKSPAASGLPVNASAVKKANTPKINFVGKHWGKGDLDCFGLCRPFFSFCLCFSL